MVTGYTGGGDDERKIPNVPKEDREKLNLGVDKEQPNWNIVGDNRIKKVFKIDVGNVSEEEVEEYIKKIAKKFKNATQIQPDLDCGVYMDNDKDIFIPPTKSANYFHVIPNSHFWTNLKQIVYSIDHELLRQEREKEPKDNKSIYVGEPLTGDYILIGLGNSLMRGYNLKRDKSAVFDTKHIIIFSSIEDMIDYVQSEKFTLEGLNLIISNTIKVGFNLTNGLKMEREHVYKRIDGERDYQDKTWVARRTLDGTPDEEKSVAEWINYMEYHLSKAKDRVYHLDTQEALAEVRKVAALAVRTMEIHGAPERQRIADTNDVKSTGNCCSDNCDCKK